MVFVKGEILLLLVSVFMLSQWEYNRHKHKEKENKRVIICICLCLSLYRGCSQNACLSFAGQDWALRTCHVVTHLRPYSSYHSCLRWALHHVNAVLPKQDDQPCASGYQLLER